MATKIMGIVNVTPDSFYAESRTAQIDEAITRALDLQKEGADIIDIGGESTRPQAEDVSLEEELQRVLPVLQALQKQKKTQISIDTMKPEVAELAIREGATLINDVSGFRDPKMRKLAADAKVDVCVMHMQGSPKTMQLQPEYEKGVVQEVFEWLDMQTKLLLRDGVEAARIIVDPGIGFGKTVEDNFALVRNAHLFRSLGFKLLYGASRKSFLKNFLNVPTEGLLSATVAVNSFLALSKVDILRVHDVKAHRDVLDILAKITLGKK